MKIIILLFTLLFSTVVFAAKSPVGYWQTIDDVTGKPKGIVQISETSDKTLQGMILKVFPRPGQPPKLVCTACEGAMHNQRIIGMRFLDNLKQNIDNKNEWNGGEITDPNNGKTYHCLMQLSKDGTRLNVRGYIGMPLLGRTQTWVRTDAV